MSPECIQCSIDALRARWSRKRNRLVTSFFSSLYFLIFLLMKRFSISLFFFFLLCTSGILLACAQQKGSQTTSVVKSDLGKKADTTFFFQRERLMDIPSIPEYLITPKDRAKYFIQHYWDLWDGQDSTYLQHPKAFEQTVVDYLGVVLSVTEIDLPTQKSHLLAPLALSRGRILETILGFYQKYLYEAESPFYNEELFLHVLEWAAKTPTLSYAQGIRTQALLELLNRNRVGSPVENFPMVTSESDSIFYVSELKGKPIILFFYTPGCDNCHNSLRELNENTLLHNLIEEERVELLLLFNGYGKDVWRNSFKELPPIGKVVYNEGDTILNTPLFDLRRSPSIYLIDAEGRVQLRNTTIQELQKKLNK